MARTFKGRRIGETYIKCKCVGVTSESGGFSKYIYEPVCGTGNIVVNMPVVLNDDIVPMEHLRMKTQVDLLTKLKYPRARMSEIIGAPEYLIDFYLPRNYVGLDRNNIYNEFHRINARCTELKEAMESEQAEKHRMYKRCAELTEKNAKLSQALESEMADNIQFEHRGKELTEENAKLNEALESAMADIRYLENSRKEMVEKNGNLAKQLSDLQEKADTLSSEYIRVCKVRDEHIKHINTLEHQIEDLEHEKKVTADMYDLANKTLCEVRAENAKLQERIDAYAIIMRSHIDSSSLKSEALELGKWVFTAVGALHHEGKSIEEIADLLEMPATFVTHVLKDF